MADTKIKNNLVVTGSSITKAGEEVSTPSATETLSNKTIDASSNTIQNLTDSNFDPSAAVGYDKLDLSNSIVNADINSAADIAVSKLASVTASRALQSDVSGKVSASSVTSTELGYVSGVTSAIQTQLGNKIDSSEKGANNGVATLDAGGKVPVAQLPNSIMEFKGVFDPGTATFTDASGNAGDVYLANAAGSYDAGAGSITYAIGDWAVHNGTEFEKAINSNSVVSVNGQQGVVTLDTDDISEGTAKYFTDERAQDAIGAMVANSSKVSLTYVDGSPSLTADIVAGSLVDADINYAADISLSKLEAVTASRALVSDGTGFVSASSVTSTELGYVSGVTSGIQSQINGKQDSDSTLTALAGYLDTGIMVQTAADTFAGRSISNSDSKLSITNGDGVAGNIVIDVNESNLDLAAIGGTLGTGSGGTGATTPSDAFDNLAPVASGKGDIIAYSGSTYDNLPVGTNGQYLKANSVASLGVEWATIPGVSVGDIGETSFSIANNQAVAANITGFAFAGTVRSFKALVSVKIDATADLYESFEILGINKGSSFDISVQSVGDSSLVDFVITSGGQMQYTSSNYSGFVAGEMRFKAHTTND